ACLGYRVLKAQDAQSALYILQSGMPIDMLFTDVVMPGSIRSPELARQAKQLFPNIEVLFTSGYTQNAIVHGGRLDPGVELLSKPYRREDLARKIRQMFAKARSASNSAASPELAVLEAVGDASTPLRILVVEDNEDAQLMVCELLMMLGHQVQGVISAEEALAVLATHSFDVLLTDIGLPGMNGIELARQATKNLPELKIIFSSGYGNLGSHELEPGWISLPKPFNLKKLQTVLAEAGT
ncbi:MAG: hypothetical protein JWQ00_3020, partial [Noviherbaspirillum sp.]|nr:hypothetical protein [Noviherbaspirillum sp.]